MPLMQNLGNLCQGKAVMNMSILITGDTHGTLDITKLIKFFENAEDSYTKEDFLIICGDVGVCSVGSKRDEAETRKILRNLPVTTLFVDGNHENFGELNSYAVEQWHGGKVHMIADDLIHLMRGQVFEIEGKTFFTFGGGYSVDRKQRSEGIDWFPEEMPSREEYQEGLDNLGQVDFRVDYIITHTVAAEVLRKFGKDPNGEERDLRQYLQRVADHTEFSAWYFGHFHIDESADDTYYCLYDEIVVL